MTLRSIALVFVLAGLAAAQGRTFVVDQANGPGTNFLDLPQAVAQAADGDRLIVRAGTYTGFTTAKALTILGEGLVQVFAPFVPPGAPAVEVRGLASGKTFVMKNLQLTAVFSTSALALALDAGRIHLEDVHVDGFTAFVQMPTGLLAASCTEVTVTGGRLDGWPAMSCGDSFVSLVGTQVVGGSASNSPRGSTRPAAGIRATRSALLLSRTDVAGGSGSLLFPGASSAIVETDSAVTLAGNATTLVVAGSGGQPTSAVDSTRGGLLVDPAIGVAGSGGAPAFSGSATVVLRPVASLRADGAPIGGTAHVELVAPAGDPIAVLASRPADPALLPEGFVCLDPFTVVPLIVGPQGPSGFWTTTIPVPMDPNLRGIAVAFQAGWLDRTRNALELSNPAVIVVD